MLWREETIKEKGIETMKTKAAITTAFGACALLLGASAVHAADFDAAMGSILADYLKIQAALAADSIEGVEGPAHAIQDSAKKLRAGHAAAEHAEHYKNIPQDLVAACEELHGADDIESVREAFKNLSKPVSMWVSMAKPEHMSVMHCPMAKAGWVQRGSDAANPYLGGKMKSCGQVVGGAGH
jgi:Cu(I)/Ag(I) efflux system membrane fusion protein